MAAWTMPAAGLLSSGFLGRPVCQALRKSDEASQGMKGFSTPAWLNDSRWYYSLVGEGAAQPVSVFDATDCKEVTEESPGTLCLSLEPRFRYSPRVRVVDARGGEVGVIRPEGLVPGVRYAMYRDCEPAWGLSVRSIVRKRHALKLANGVSWTVYTPFFGCRWVGTVDGIPRMFGIVGPSWWGVWQIWVEPGWETVDLLSAVAFMHRQWSLM